MTKAIIMSLICAYSQVFGVDPKVSLAVARVESNYKPSAVGSLGERGIFQLRPEFITGFSKEQLQNPYINIPLGINKLKNAKETCIFQKDIYWLICYNYGNEAAKHVKHPELFPYVIRVKNVMKKI